MRTGLRHWLRRPAGMLALVLLLLALVAGNTVRAQVHAHAHGEDPHVFHVQDMGYHASGQGHGYDQHDHWLGHGSGGDHGNGAGKPGEEPPVHIHTASMVATVVPTVTNVPPVVLTAVPLVAGVPGTVLPPSPPSELFRPPIS